MYQNYRTKINSEDNKKHMLMFVDVFFIKKTEKCYCGETFESLSEPDK